MWSVVGITKSLCGRLSTFSWVHGKAVSNDWPSDTTGPSHLSPYGVASNVERELCCSFRASSGVRTQLSLGWSPDGAPLVRLLLLSSPAWTWTFVGESCDSESCFVVNTCAYSFVDLPPQHLNVSSPLYLFIFWSGVGFWGYGDIHFLSYTGLLITVYFWFRGSNNTPGPKPGQLEFQRPHQVGEAVWWVEWWHSRLSELDDNARSRRCYLSYSVRPRWEYSLFEQPRGGFRFVGRYTLTNRHW